MGEAVLQNQQACRPADVAAYLDGELDSATHAGFERHARACRPCAAALNEQKRLLCLLDTAFPVGAGREQEFVLPKNFARIVAAHAQTDMRSMREKPERRRALLMCALLALSAFGLLGMAVFDAATVPLAGLARSVFRLFAMIGHTLADAATGAALILRAVGGRLLDEPQPFKVLTWALLAGATALLLRLISSYHRARTHED